MILSAAMVAFLVSRDCSSQQVYATGIYATGTTDWGAGSTVLPFSPFNYDMTEIGWLETSNGDYIAGIPQSMKGLVSRRSLEVTCGSDVFYMPLDSGPPTQFKYQNWSHSPVTKGSGDLASVIMRCAANRGARMTTNALPAVQASWLFQARTNEDIIVLEDDHFTQVENLLERAYGKLDDSIRSSGFAGGDCQSISYSPAQTGIFLNLTRTWDDATIVSIVGKESRAPTNSMLDIER